MVDEVACLIGDVRGSRHAVDRVALHARLTGVLDEVNDRTAPLTPLRAQLGDEFQGTFASVATAAHAALLLRVALLPDHDLRQGLGWGVVRVLQEQPRLEDGPGWWAARDAVHAVEQAESRPGSAWRRTAYREAEPTPGSTPGPPQAWVEPALVLRDQAVGALSDRGVSVRRGLLAGRTQREIAAELGISASAVSQRVRADGIAAVLTSDEMLREAR